MAATDLTIVDTDHQPHYRQVMAPSHVSGSFTADDTADHDFRADGRGKGRASVLIDNPANKDITITVYGAQGSASEIGDGDVKQIGQFTVNSANGTTDSPGYETLNDPFPYYIVRAAYAAAPTDSPSETTTVYVNLES